MSVMKKLGLLLIVLAAVGACSGVKTAEPGTNTRYDAPRRDKEAGGGIFSGEGGIVDLFSSDSKKESGSGIGVNSFLWRASLDTISFMPLASADPFGGVIITDWYAPPATPGERFKVNVFILSKDLRADGIRTSVFRQSQDNKGGWKEVEVAPETVAGLENAILNRARELRTRGLQN